LRSGSVAGNWLFSGRCWIDPSDPEGFTKLDLHYHNLRTLFPDLTIACPPDRFVGAVAAVGRSWAYHAAAHAAGIADSTSIADFAPLSPLRRVADAGGPPLSVATVCRLWYAEADCGPEPVEAECQPAGQPWKLLPSSMHAMQVTRILSHALAGGGRTGTAEASSHEHALSLHPVGWAAALTRARQEFAGGPGQAATQPDGSCALWAGRHAHTDRPARRAQAAAGRLGAPPVEFEACGEYAWHRTAHDGGSHAPEESPYVAQGAWEWAAAAGWSGGGPGSSGGGGGGGGGGRVGGGGGGGKWVGEWTPVGGRHPAQRRGGRDDLDWMHGDSESDAAAPGLRPKCGHVGGGGDRRGGVAGWERRCAADRRVRREPDWPG
jgi:uncharacterized membrane protein YgcG